MGTSLHFYPAKPARRPRYKATVPRSCEFYLVSLAEDGQWIAEHSLVGTLSRHETMSLAMNACETEARQRAATAAERSVNLTDRSVAH